MFLSLDSFQFSASRPDRNFCPHLMRKNLLDKKNTNYPVYVYVYVFKIYSMTGHAISRRLLLKIKILTLTFRCSRGQVLTPRCPEKSGVFAVK